MIGKLTAWLRAGLRRLYPVAPPSEHDPVGAICRDALTANKVATIANKQAAQDTHRAMASWLHARQPAPLARHAQHH